MDLSPRWHLLHSLTCSGTRESDQQLRSIIGIHFFDSSDMRRYITTAAGLMLFLLIISVYLLMFVNVMVSHLSVIDSSSQAKLTLVGLPGFSHTVIYPSCFLWITLLMGLMKCGRTERFLRITTNTSFNAWCINNDPHIEGDLGGGVRWVISAQQASHLVFIYGERWGWWRVKCSL